MRKIVMYLPPEATIANFVRHYVICASGPTISGNYAENMGEEGAPGGIISSDDIIDGGTF